MEGKYSCFSILFLLQKKQDITMLLNGEKFGWIACRAAN